MEPFRYSYYWRVQIWCITFGKIHNVLTTKRFQLLTLKIACTLDFLHSSPNISRIYMNRKDREPNAEHTTGRPVKQVKLCFRVSCTFVMQHVRILQTLAAHCCIQLGANAHNNKTSTLPKERKRKWKFEREMN